MIFVPSTFDQRSYRGEIALAFGLSKPAFQNSYGEIDLVAAALTYHITNQLKIDMATAAGLVRQHWREWLAPRSGARRKAKAALGNAAYPPLEAAPGRYVREP